MEKAFISTPMSDRSPEEIQESLRRAAEYLKKKGYTAASSYDPDGIYNAAKEGIKNPSLYMLGKSFVIMSDCDAVFFCRGWDHSRGCKLEFEAAFDYGLDIYHEEEFA